MAAAGVVFLEAAGRRIDAIYRHSRQTWGEARARSYVSGLFDACQQIDGDLDVSRPVPGEFGVTGFVFRYQSHMIYWRRLADGRVGVVTVLHVSMHQIDRLKGDWGLEP